jgi:hypothetical protein
MAGSTSAFSLGSALSGATPMPFSRRVCKPPFVNNRFIAERGDARQKQSRAAKCNARDATVCMRSSTRKMSEREARVSERRRERNSGWANI